MNLLLMPVVAGLLAVVTADTNEFGSSEVYVVTDRSRPKAAPSSYSSSSVGGFSERSDNSQQLSSHDGTQSFQPSSYSSLFETGFETPRPYSNFRRNDLQTSGFGASFGAPGLLQAGASPAGSISNYLGGYNSGAQGIGLGFGQQQGGLGGHFGAQQQAFNPYQMQQFQSQLGGLGGQGFSPLQQPLQLGSGAEAFSRYALPGQGFQGSAFSDLGQQGLLSGGQYLGGSQNFQTTAQLPFDVQQVLRQAAQSMQQPSFTPRGTQAFGSGFAPLQSQFGGALGGFGGGGGGGGFGGGGRGSSSNSGRGSNRGSGSSVTSRLFAPLTQLASSIYGSLDDDDTRRADSSQRTRGRFPGRGSQG